MKQKITIMTIVNNETENPNNLINSFINQTLQDKELMILTDSAIEEQENIKVYNSRKTSGGYDFLVEKATGDYFLFMHPNEYFSKDTALEELLAKCIEGNAQAIVFANARLDNGVFYFAYYGDNIQVREVFPSGLPLVMAQYPEFRKWTGVLFAREIVTIPYENGQKNLFASLSQANKILFDTASYYVIPADMSNSLVESESNDIPMPYYVEKDMEEEPNCTGPISIALCVDNNYGRYLGTLLYSIHQHHEYADIYIVYDDLDKKILRLIIDIQATLTNLNITMKKMPRYIIDKIKMITATFTGLPVSAYYRLFLPELFPDLERVLYMDIDVAVLKNLDDFYYTDFEGNSLVAVMDAPEEPALWQKRLLGEEYEKYFNSGVLLMNLRIMRKHNHVSQLLPFITENYLYLMYDDQDALNLFYRGAVKLFPLTYNWKPFNYKCNTVEAEELRVIHFAGWYKPWINNRIDDEKVNFLTNRYRTIQLAANHQLHRQPRVYVFTDYDSDDKHEKHKFESLLMQIEANMDLFILYDDDVATSIFYYDQLSPYIHLVPRKNRSNLEVMREVLSESSTDYVYCLFGKDYLDTNESLCQMVTLSADYRAEVAFSNYILLVEKEGTFYSYNASKTIQLVSPNQFEKFQERNVTNLRSLQGTLFSAPLLKKALQEDFGSEERFINDLLAKQPLTYYIDYHCWVHRV